MAIPFFETGDPARLWMRRIGFDRALLLLIFIVMCDRLTENPLHEALGTVAGAAVVFHMALNRRWYERRLGILPRAVAAGTARARGRKHRPMRTADRLQFAVNVLLTAVFAASFISGVMCSQTLFAGLTPEAWRMDLAYRTAHVALSMWFFLAAALHAGIHAYVLAGPRISSAFSRLGVRLAAGFLLILMAVRHSSSPGCGSSISFSALRAPTFLLSGANGRLGCRLTSLFFLRLPQRLASQPSRRLIASMLDQV